MSLGAARGSRPRAGRPPGPADPGVAVRLGRLAGAHRLLLRALGRLAHAAASRRPAGGALRPVVSQALLNPAVEVLCGALGVFLLGLTVWAGLNGTEAPDRNFSVTFVFVTVWLGLVVLSVVFGDVFRAFNPWRAIARVVGGAVQAGRRPVRPAAARLPRALGAVAGRARPGRLRLARARLRPGRLSDGRPDAAHRRGRDPRLHRLHVRRHDALREREVARARRDLLGLLPHVLDAWRRSRSATAGSGSAGRSRPRTRWVAEAPGSVALVLFTIGATTFDGAAEGTLAEPISHGRGLVRRPRARAAGGAAGHQLDLPRALPRLRRRPVLGRDLRHAHGPHQAQHARASGGCSPTRSSRSRSPTWSPTTSASSSSRSRRSSRFLLSDPLGDGSDIFGTAGSGIDYGAISANAIWYVQVGALIVGHVTALVLGHDRALKVYGDPRVAARSQYWMLALMVGFTSLGLFLLSQSNA